MKKFKQDIRIYKDRLIIIQKKEKEFNSPIVFVTYPSPGIIGPIISKQMIDSLDLEEIGFFKSDALSPVTIFTDNVLKHPYLIYSNKEGTIVLLTIEYPIPPESYLTISEGLINWIETHLEAICIVSFSGIPMKVKPKKSIVITAAEKEKAEELKQFSVELFDHGVILGLSGAIMSEALLSDIVGITLMTPTRANFPDPEAAAKLIDVVNDYFDLKIETEPLLKEADKIKEKLAMIAEHQKALDDQIAPSVRKRREGYV
jgi:uncharacterized protein